MKYMGSKNRIAKHLLPIMLENRNGRTWVEPFVGGANMIDKVDGKRIGADFNEYVISLFTGIQNGFMPPNEVSEEEYRQARLNRVVMPLVSFIGFGCSYSGKWFGGYARGNTNKGEPRNYCLESKKNILKQAENLNDVEFVHSSYQDLEIPKNSLIYCDPPYEGTTKYKDGFSHAEFWEWCRTKTKEGHQVFISEYNAPRDFKSIYSKEVNSSLTKDTGSKKANEQLFVYCG
jgi:DNA adenine methylase